MKSWTAKAAAVGAFLTIALGSVQTLADGVQGCCSSHGGVCGCSSASGAVTCCDGSASRTCRCPLQRSAVRWSLTSKSSYLSTTETVQREGGRLSNSPLGWECQQEPVVFADGAERKIEAVT